MTAYLFSTTSSFGRTDYSAVPPDVTGPTIAVYAYAREASVYVSGIMLTKGENGSQMDAAEQDLHRGD